MSKPIRDWLNMLHQHEDEWNHEMGIIDKEIKKLSNRKNHLITKISNNVKLRNKLIAKL